MAPYIILVFSPFTLVFLSTTNHRTDLSGTFSDFQITGRATSYTKWKQVPVGYKVEDTAYAYTYIYVCS